MRLPHPLAISSASYLYSVHPNFEKIKSQAKVELCNSGLGGGGP